ncbi:MAG TPA: malate synthase A [Ignavibacteriaceae bacterium]|nr:malate synthase A [Ignavibacteriaceae bacterium]
MATAIDQLVTGIEVKGRITAEVKEILTPDAIQFISKLHHLFNPRRKELLRKRDKRQEEIDSGIMPNFLEETRSIRESDWTVAKLPDDLLDRRVEITGPVERKMIINALNSGANVFMADFEDSNSPTWENVIEGQVNLKDAVEETISYINPETGKLYKLNEKTAVLMVRPRGWHLEEKHFLIDEENISASLFDFGLYFFHNVQNLINKGTSPYFYLPKMESHLEARLWNDVFVFAQQELGIPNGTIKATVLIETILAAFEMDEILYELKDHSAGLNCGRWDYIFSFIKKFKNHPMFILPDRAQVTMTSHFMHSYSLLLIKTCHKRNVHAMGGMAAQIPIKNNPEANKAAMEKVKLDKEREAKDGHDGTWVAHPGLVPIAKEIFNEFMPEQNQINNKREDVNVSAEALLSLPVGTITLEGLKTNIDVGIQYIEAWLRGNGCVPIYNLMEDAATAEISRTQVWQWLNNRNSALEDGSKISDELYSSILAEQIDKIRETVGEEIFSRGSYSLAAEIFDSLVREKKFTEFLTLKAYEYI